MDSNIVIVTRHSGQIKWLSQQGIEGVVIAHATEDDIKGKDVIGNLPLHLASLANTVTSVDLPNLPPNLRGQDLTPQQMNEAGAILKKYKVLEIS